MDDPALCRKKIQLKYDVQVALSKLSQLIESQLGALADAGIEKVREIDHEIELCFGEKERAIGALQQHLKEHGC